MNTITKKRHKLLLIGYRGYGDWLYAVPILKYLFEKYEVHLETSRQGWDLFHDDTRFKSKTFYDIRKMYNAIFFGAPIDEMKIVTERWKKLEDTLKPDRTINLFRTLESKCVAEKWQDEYYMTTEERRNIFGSMDWHEQIFKVCDMKIPDELDLTGLQFKQSQIDWAESWKKSHRNNFIILIAIGGSGFHKRYVFFEDIINKILNKYDNTKIYLIGGSEDKCTIKHERVFNVLGNAPYKQVVLMAKYADLVIGPETGLHVAAGMWGTPKIQLCNMSNVYQLTKYHRNDYSIQANIECSPCHKMVNSIYDCGNMVIYDYEMMPPCSLSYDVNDILNKIEKVLGGKYACC